MSKSGPKLNFFFCLISRKNSIYGILLNKTMYLYLGFVAHYQICPHWALKSPKFLGSMMCKLWLWIFENFKHLNLAPHSFCGRNSCYVKYLIRIQWELYKAWMCCPFLPELFRVQTLWLYQAASCGALIKILNENWDWAKETSSKHKSRIQPKATIGL